MKEALRKRVGDIALDHFSTYLWLRHGKSIHPRARANFNFLAQKMKKGKPIPFSEYVSILSGYEKVISGQENLKNINGPVLIIANHFTDTPLGHHPISAMLGFLTEETTKTKFHWLYGNHGSIIKLFSERYARSTNSIPVDSISSMKELIKIMRAKQVSFGLYPEGDGGKEMREGVPDASHIILSAHKNEMPIIPIGVWYEKGFFAFNIGKAIDFSEISQILAASKDMHKLEGQVVVNFGMKKIAVLIPPHMRGFYK